MIIAEMANVYSISGLTNEVCGYDCDNTKGTKVLTKMNMTSSNCGILWVVG